VSESQQAGDPGNRPRQVEVGANFDTSVLPFQTGTSDRFTYTQSFAPLDLSAFGEGDAIVVEPDPLQQLEQQFASNIGLLFLDRTRIVPMTTVLGEELISMSLAPGETVVLQQQSTSQSTVSFEQQDETDQELTQQFTSTLTSAIEQGLNNQQQNSDKTQSGISGTAGFTYNGVTVSASPNFSNSVNSGDNATQQQSVRNTTQAAQQVATTYRSQHKTVLSIATQQTFQTSKQRTITNPNKFTPVDLRYFKIYLQLQLSLERFGVRLAWAPTVQKPGRIVLAAAQEAYSATIAAAVSSASLPAAPVPPAPPVDPPPESVSNPPGSLTFSPGFPGAGVSADKTVTLANPNPAAYQWDGKAPVLAQTLGGNPTNAARVTNFTPNGNDVDVSIHVGYGSSVTYNPTLVATVTVTFVPLPTQADIAYQAALALYNQQLAAYNAQVAALQAAAAAGAQKSAQAAYNAVVAAADPFTASLTELIGSNFPAAMYSTPGEIDVLRSLFDWTGSSVQLYPAWWANAPLNDPGYPATAFINASWARLYLPVKPGMEDVALRAIAAITGTPITTAQAEALIAQLEAYREANFGDPNEAPTAPGEEGGCPAMRNEFICLATWQELLPTDGTHLEVLQASTSADDDLTDQALAVREALVEAETTALGHLRNVDKVQVILKVTDGDLGRDDDSRS
jgi:hypothetical protein